MLPLEKLPEIYSNIQKDEGGRWHGRGHAHHVSGMGCHVATLGTPEGKRVCGVKMYAQDGAVLSRYDELYKMA